MEEVRIVDAVLASCAPRGEGRKRGAKGLRNLVLHGFAAHRLLLVDLPQLGRDL